MPFRIKSFKFKNRINADEFRINPLKKSTVRNVEQPQRRDTSSVSTKPENCAVSSTYCRHRHQHHSSLKGYQILCASSFQTSTHFASHSSIRQDPNQEPQFLLLGFARGRRV